MTQATRRLAWLAALCAGVVAAYAAGLSGAFAVDDYTAILPLAARAGAGEPWWSILANVPPPNHVRPLSNLSFLLTHALSGAPAPPSAFAFKAFNLALHLACALALAALGTRLARAWGADAPRAAGVGLLAAALFALHPLLASTVLYPVQRMAQLSTLFLLLACVAWLRWRERLADPGAGGHYRGLAWVAAFGMLAVLSKENGVLLPLLIGAMELTLPRPPRETPPQARHARAMLAFCFVPLALGVLLLAWRWPFVLAAYGLRDFTLAERLMTQLHVVADYLAQIAWPRVSGMGLYRDDVVPVREFGAATAALLAALLAVLAAAVAWRRRWPAFAFGVAWFAAAHAMESTVISLELAFEHRNYLALPGVAVAVAWGLWHLPRRALLAASAVVLLGLGVQAARRAYEWGDYGRFIAAEAAHRPGSLRARSDPVGWEVVRGEVEAARREAQRLFDDFPGDAQPAIVGLWLHCLAPGTLAPAHVERLQRGRIDNGALHVVSGLRDRKAAGRCEPLDWGILQQAARAVATSTHRTLPTRQWLAWHRLWAMAGVQRKDWAGVDAALDALLARDPGTAQDWLLRMQATLSTGDAAGFRAARERFMLHVPQYRQVPDFLRLEQEAAARFGGPTP